MSAAATVVIGGGISGLVAALVLARRGEAVTVIESEGQLGGLLRRLDYGEAGSFDCGMHNMYETGVAELDELLFGLLPENEWQVFSGAQRDLAGVFVDGRLQQNSPYVDLRAAPPDTYRDMLGDLMVALAAGGSSAPTSAEQFARGHFGDAIAEHAILPAMRKLFHREAAELDPFAAVLTPLSRVILFDKSIQADLMQSALLRDRVAFPEQRHLPAAWASARRGFYPRQFGIYRIIDALRERLQQLGVTILMDAKIVALKTDDGQVSAIEYMTGGAKHTIGPIRDLVWTVALPALAPLLEIKLGDRKPDKPLRTVVTNLLLRDPPRMGDLYYLYCYQAGLDCFRVTNYGAYCSGAKRAGGHPVCHEMLIDSSALMPPEELARQAVREMLQMGLIEDESDVTFARTEILASGFPMPTVNNMEILAGLREAIRDRGIGNLRLCGIMSEPGIFFQRDVLAHTFSTLQNRD